jgi:hypothetical protein
MTPADKDLKYRLKYNTILAIHGQPKLSLWFEGLPSMNTYYNMHRFARSAATAEWRYEARQKAYDTTLFMDDFLIQRALVVVNVFPPYEEISAGVWSDDEWAFCPLVMYAWAGIGEQKPRQHKVRRTRIDLYELAQYKVRGEAQILPKGRKKLYG